MRSYGGAVNTVWPHKLVLTYALNVAGSGNTKKAFAAARTPESIAEARREAELRRTAVKEAVASAAGRAELQSIATDLQPEPAEAAARKAERKAKKAERKAKKAEKRAIKKERKERKRRRKRDSDSSSSTS